MVKASPELKDKLQEWLDTQSPQCLCKFTANDKLWAEMSTLWVEQGLDRTIPFSVSFAAMYHEHQFMNAQHNPRRLAWVKSVLS